MSKAEINKKKQEDDIVYFKRSGNRITSNVWSQFSAIRIKSTNRIVDNHALCSRCETIIEYSAGSTTRLDRHKCSKLNQPSVSTFLNKVFFRLIINFYRNHLLNAY